MSGNRVLSRAYHSWRQLSLGEVTDQRSAWGAREYETMIACHRIAGLQFGPVGGDSKQVIDLGCGDSHVEAAFSAAGWSYRGIDIDECDFDSGRLPVDDSSQDLIISLAVLEHLTNPINLLSEIRRVARPGGTVVLSTPNWNYCMRSFWNDPTHVRPYTALSLRRLAEIGGLEAVIVLPGLRCKPDWCYRGRSAFWRARWLFPFTGEQRWAPRFFRGKSTSLFLVAQVL